jgi:hypothetical protein
MLPEKSDSDNVTQGAIWGVTLLFCVLQVGSYFNKVWRHEDDKNYEDIIAEKDKIIEEQQRQLDRQMKIIESLK